MTPLDLRAAAVAQNERDCAAYGIPRYVEDEATLRAVAQLLVQVGEEVADAQVA